MPTRRQTIEITDEEDRERLRDAGLAAVQQFAREQPDAAQELRRAHRFQIGLITLQDLCEVYSVTPDTVRAWGVAPIDYPGRKNLYHVDEIKAHVMSAKNSR